MEYTLATMNDLPAIKALLARYHKDTISQEDIAGGFVTTKLSDQQFEDLIVNRKGVTLAKDENGTVKAFALAAGWDYWMQVPIMKRMTEVLPDMPFEGTALDETNTYQYGPVCVDGSGHHGLLGDHVGGVSAVHLADGKDHIVSRIHFPGVDGLESQMDVGHDV